MRVRVLAASLALLGLGVVRAEAQAHPSLAGTWVLDPAKSVVEGQAVAPDSASRVIVQRRDTIWVDAQVATGDRVVKTHSVWGLDGKPWKNVMQIAGNDVDVSSVLGWDGSTLVAHSTYSAQGASIEQTDRWSLSTDEKFLVAKRNIAVDGNEIGSATLTFHKKN